MLAEMGGVECAAGAVDSWCVQVGGVAGVCGWRRPAQPQLVDVGQAAGKEDARAKQHHGTTAVILVHQRQARVLKAPHPRAGAAVSLAQSRAEITGGADPNRRSLRRRGGSPTFTATRGVSALSAPAMAGRRATKLARFGVSDSSLACSASSSWRWAARSAGRDPCSAEKNCSSDQDSRPHRHSSPEPSPPTLRPGRRIPLRRRRRTRARTRRHRPSSCRHCRPTTRRDHPRPHHRRPPPAPPPTLAGNPLDTTTDPDAIATSDAYAVGLATLIERVPAAHWA